MQLLGASSIPSEQLLGVVGSPAEIVQNLMPNHAGVVPSFRGEIDSVLSIPHSPHLAGEHTKRRTWHSVPLDSLVTPAQARARNHRVEVRTFGRQHPALVQLFGVEAHCVARQNDTRRGNLTTRHTRKTCQQQPVSHDSSIGRFPVERHQRDVRELICP